MIKHLLKASKEEKIPSVRATIVACLRVLVHQTLNYSTLHANYDLIFSAACKGFEEPETSVQQEWVLVCSALIGMRLQESKQQGDIKTGFRTYNQ